MQTEPFYGLTVEYKDEKQYPQYLDIKAAIEEAIFNAVPKSRPEAPSKINATAAGVFLGIEGEKEKYFSAYFKNGEIHLGVAEKNPDGKTVIKQHCTLEELSRIYQDKEFSYKLRNRSLVAIKEAKSLENGKEASFLMSGWEKLFITREAEKNQAQEPSKEKPQEIKNNRTQKEGKDQVRENKKGASRMDKNIWYSENVRKRVIEFAKEKPELNKENALKFLRIMKDEMQEYNKDASQDIAVTYIHSLHVAAFAEEMARQNCEPKELQEKIYLSALLHDVGKMMTPKELLEKPGKLTSEEREIINRHSPLGGEILKYVFGKDIDKEILQGVVLHHPNNGKLKELPELPRITQYIEAADILDAALDNNRAYKGGESKETAKKWAFQDERIEEDIKEAGEMMVDYLHDTFQIDIFGNVDVYDLDPELQELCEEGTKIAAYREFVSELNSQEGKGNLLNAVEKVKIAHIQELLTVMKHNIDIGTQHGEYYAENCLAAADFVRSELEKNNVTWPELYTALVSTDVYDKNAVLPFKEKFLVTDERDPRYALTQELLYIRSTFCMREFAPEKQQTKQKEERAAIEEKRAAFAR